MGKYSKEYNIQHKQIREFLTEFKDQYHFYQTILEQVKLGDFKLANQNCLSLSNQAKTINQCLLNSDSKIQKLFLRKWIDKYHRYDVFDPFLSLIDDIDDILISIQRIFEMRGEKYE